MWLDFDIDENSSRFEPENYLTKLLLHLNIIIISHVCRTLPESINLV